MMRKMQKQQGFTIIELVVVILLLGILTATALPRFMDVTEEAHDAAVSGVLGGLSTGVGLFRAQWFGKGQPQAGKLVPGFGNGLLATNGSGYPIGLDSTQTSISAIVDCTNIFGNVLQGGAPSVGATTVAAGTTYTSANLDTDRGAGISTDYVVQIDLASSAKTCEYVYVGQYQDASLGSIPVISLDTITGEVSLGQF